MHALLNHFDRRAASVVGRLPAAALPLMRAVSFIGLPVVVISAASAFAAVCWFGGYPLVAEASLASLVALSGNTALKKITRRSRPETLYVQNMRIVSYSFPSGHSFGSAVFYGLLAYLTSSSALSPWNLLVPIFLTLLIGLIGLSRVYLQAHFPSDVVVGWLLGGGCLAVIIRVFLV